MAKGFSWSYSKYKNYDTCPKRHYEVDIAKTFAESSEQLVWGNQVHDALRDATTGKAALPDSMKDYQRWVDEIKSGVFASSGQQPWMRWLAQQTCEVLVEQKYAITKSFGPTLWFGHDVWFRGIADVVRLDPTKTIGLARDYKTGQIKHDSRQLMLMSQCLFAHIPTLQRLRTEFVWLKDDCVTPETFGRATIMREWPPILIGVKEMEKAALTMTYPPKPGKLCRKWCPVMSCPYHGKGY